MKAGSPKRDPALFYAVFSAGDPARTETLSSDYLVVYGEPGSAFFDLNAILKINSGAK